jgi:hypothetical protein
VLPLIHHRAIRLWGMTLVHSHTRGLIVRTHPQVRSTVAGAPGRSLVWTFALSSVARSRLVMGTRYTNTYTRTYRRYAL